MKKILAGALGGAAALAVIFGAGPALADNEYVGRTYAQVQGYTNNRAVIASRTGSYLPTEECIVTGNRRAKILDSSGNATTKIMVDLNCNDTTALNGHPGNSVVTPAGQKALKDRERADNLSKNYARAIEAGTTPNCLSNDGAIGYCIKLCNETKNCSAELLEALGQ